jgi:predicted nucleotidyltransferase
MTKVYWDNYFHEQLKHNEIIDVLNKLQKKEDIKIIFAIESGSRAWGFPSIDSDYDIRFVFQRPTYQYHLTKEPKMTIDTMENEDLDIVGEDIRVFTKYILASNPSRIEWLNSPIVIMDDGVTKNLYRRYIESRFNPEALYYNYYGLCKNNYMKSIANNKKVTHKKYLYCMRGLLNALWTVQFTKIPPMNFQSTLNKIQGVPDPILRQLEEIIKIKQRGEEKQPIKRIELLDTYITKFLETRGPIAKRTITDAEILECHKLMLLGFDETIRSNKKNKKGVK